MALTQITTGGLANGAVTSSKISNTVQLGGPTISQIQITDSSYNVLDDTAVSTSGGYIKITGTGFAAGAIVVIGSVNATSTGFVSSTVLNVQVPALTAGTYTVYVVNTNGGTAIGVNGLTYSGTPTWVTASTLSNGVSGTPISIQLSATGDTPMTYALAAGNTLPSGLTLTSGGLLSGTVTVGIETVYAFTVVATDVQLQDSPRAFTITITVGDPYFYLTTLLLPGNGTNNGTNNTFLDSSTNAYAITRNGNTTQGTYTPYSLTGWSNYFDGNGDYLSAPGSAAFNLSASNYTIELWFYKLSDKLCTLVSQGGESWRIQPLANGGMVLNLNSADSITYNTAISLNTWHHIAVVKNSATTTMYLDGVSIGTTTNNASNDSASTIYVGINPANSGWAYNGYISNLRVVKGTAVYTTNFTPPTAALTAITNTQLLTCQSNRLKDNSTNNLTITKYGDTSVQSYSPFAPVSSYSTSTVGGSAYFDGNGDWLNTSSTQVIPSGSFTVEAWAFPTSSANSGLIAQGTTGNAGRYGIYIENGVWATQIGSTIATGSAPILNQWNHLASTFNGSTLTLYVNGVSVSTGSTSQNVQNTTLRVGSLGPSDWVAYYWNGYIGQIRISNNVRSIAVPTAPYTSDANTVFLSSFTNGQIIDSTSKNILETVGDAKTSTAQSKWNDSSIYLDGTGDYLIAPANGYGDLGTGDFTIEFWMRAGAAGTYVAVIGTQTIVGSATAGMWRVGNRFNSANGIYFSWSAGGSFNDITFTTTNYNDGNWYFVAITRASGTLRAFVNGTQVGSNQSLTANLTSGQRLSVGWNANDGTFYTGYLQDVRITKGYARYTTNFTAPTSAFPTL